ncbi:MAG: arsenate reductase ArsC [Candidatus Heimdallarchaeota archaeon]|nr:arsenate reductase ArsC [Candidatus Heimdallarchaeota archaeon]
MQKSVLFICTHNSVRSQIAEGLTNHYFSDWTALSAGITKASVSPFAIEILSEIGIDISQQTSKGMDQFLDTKFDIVVTVCDDAKEICPFFPNTDKLLHKNFVDPSLIEDTGENKLLSFRNTRDDILAYLKQIL